MDPCSSTLNAHACAFVFVIVYLTLLSFFVLAPNKLVIPIFKASEDAARYPVAAKVAELLQRGTVSVFDTLFSLENGGSFFHAKYYGYQGRLPESIQFTNDIPDSTIMWSSKIIRSS